jgi:hypothetical protein
VLFLSLESLDGGCTLIEFRSKNDPEVGDRIVHGFGAGSFDFLESEEESLADIAAEAVEERISAAQKAQVEKNFIMDCRQSCGKERMNTKRYKNGRAACRRSH